MTEVAPPLRVTILTRKKKSPQPNGPSPKGNRPPIDRHRELKWRSFWTAENGRRRQAIALDLSRNYLPEYFYDPAF